MKAYFIKEAVYANTELRKQFVERTLSDRKFLRFRDSVAMHSFLKEFNEEFPGVPHIKVFSRNLIIIRVDEFNKLAKSQKFRAMTFEVFI